MNKSHLRKEAIAYEMGYYVDEFGSVFTPNGLKMKVNTAENTRYPAFHIKYGEKKYSVRMHRLAAYCFYGDALYEEDMLVRHLNGDKSDMSKANIVLGTQKDNAEDITEEVMTLAAEKRRKYNLENNVKPPRVYKVPDSEVPTILEMIDNGMSQRKIAKLYGLHPSTIGYIHTNRRYTYAENKCS